jgi:hypothetical protein
VAHHLVPQGIVLRQERVKEVYWIYDPVLDPRDFLSLCENVLCGIIPVKAAVGRDEAGGSLGEDVSVMATEAGGRAEGGPLGPRGAKETVEPAHGLFTYEVVCQPLDAGSNDSQETQLLMLPPFFAKNYKQTWAVPLTLRIPHQSCNRTGTNMRSLRKAS